MKLIPGRRKSPRQEITEELIKEGYDPDQLPKGLRHLRHQWLRLMRGKRRRLLRPLKPAPQGRAELVTKQKKARPVYRRQQ
jgi:hypothetical protein